MTDRLPEIEARLEAGYYDRAFGAGEDVRWLLEEVKRQARIIKAATDERFDVAAALVRANDDCERLEGEVKRLREELDLA